MIIKPSAAIRRNSGEPVFLTKNGEGDLVVIDIETYNRREKMLRLREELLAVEEERLNGGKEYSVDEVTDILNSTINEVIGCGYERSCGFFGRV